MEKFTYINYLHYKLEARTNIFTLNEETTNYKYENINGKGTKENKTNQPHDKTYRTPIKNRLFNAI